MVLYVSAWGVRELLALITTTLPVLTLLMPPRASCPCLVAHACMHACSLHPHRVKVQACSRRSSGGDGEGVGPAHQLRDLRHALGRLGSRQRRLATACGIVTGMSLFGRCMALGAFCVRRAAGLLKRVALYGRLLAHLRLQTQVLGG